MRALFVVFSLLCASLVRAQSLSAHATAVIEQAISDMESGSPDLAIDALRRLIHDEPDALAAHYELATAYSIAGDFAHVIAVTRPLRARNDVSDIAFVLEGDALDAVGRRSEAIECYKAGLKRFPASPRLFLQLGLVAEDDDDPQLALQYYTSGIQADKSFPGNYYHAASLLLQSSEPVMGLIYGSTFRVLSPDGQQSRLVSDLLVKCLRANVRHSDAGPVVSLSSSSSLFLAPDGRMHLPLPAAFNLAVKNSKATSAFLSSHDELSLQAIATLKRDVIGFLRDKFADEFFSGILAWEEEVAAAGHWDAYCFWLLRLGDEGEFNAWMAFHEDDLEQFALWFQEHPLF